MRKLHDIPAGQSQVEPGLTDAEKKEVFAQLQIWLQLRMAEIEGACHSVGLTSLKNYTLMITDAEEPQRSMLITNETADSMRKSFAVVIDMYDKRASK